MQPDVRGAQQHPGGPRPHSSIPVVIRSRLWAFSEHKLKTCRVSGEVKDRTREDGTDPGWGWRQRPPGRRASWWRQTVDGAGQFCDVCVCLGYRDVRWSQSATGKLLNNVFSGYSFSVKGTLIRNWSCDVRVLNWFPKNKIFLKT